MLNYLKFLFKKSESDPLVISDDILRFPFPVDDMFSRNLDGFIIRNALKSETCKEIGNHLKLLSDHDCLLLPNNEGRVFPYPYSMITSEEREISYFQQSEKSTAKFPEFAALIQQLLQSLTSKQLRLMQYPDWRNFSPLNYRLLRKSSKGLTIHCENSFLHLLYPAFLDSLIEEVELYDQLSFLIVIDKPVDSGEIVLYNREWDYFKAKPEQFSDDIKKDDNLGFFLQNGQTNVKSTEVHLGNGDLFIFRAGQIWHRVKDIGSQGDRISCGGFMAKGKEGKNIFFWS